LFRRLELFGEVIPIAGSRPPPTGLLTRTLGDVLADSLSNNVGDGTALLEGDLPQRVIGSLRTSSSATLSC